MHPSIKERILHRACEAMHETGRGFLFEEGFIQGAMEERKLMARELINAQEATLNSFYQAILAQKVEFPPEIRRLLHEHMNLLINAKNKHIK